MPIQQQLQAILDGLATTPLSSTTPPVGDPIRVRLSPPLSDLQLSDAVSGDVDLTMVAKEVLFGNADLEPDFAAGALNTATTGAKPLLTSLNTFLPPPGVGGLLTQIKGKLPLPLEGKVPVNVQVQWRVFEDNAGAPGAELSSGEFAFAGPSTTPEVSVLLKPEIVELTTSALPAPRRRHLQARVSLSAGGIAVGPRDLPAVPIFVPPLAVPGAVAFFLHRNFSASGDGAVMIVVPSDSAIGGVGQLNSTLQNVRTVATKLQSIAGFAGFVLGVNDLLGAVTAQPHVIFLTRDNITNMNDIDLIVRGWFENDTEAEDEFSSMILVGPPNFGVACFNDRNRNTGEGKFTLRTTEQLFAAVNDLHAKSPGVRGGTITIDNPPTGGVFHGEDFGDRLSSMEFV